MKCLKWRLATWCFARVYRFEASVIKREWTSADRFVYRVLKTAQNYFKLTAVYPAPGTRPDGENKPDRSAASRINEKAR